MRKSLALTALLALAACGGSRNDEVPAPPESSPPSAATADSSGATGEMAAGPDIGPTAAPGVAFNYSYSFRLDADRIAPVQERHAAMCEQLGPDRCRIAGALYRVRSETDIEARLELKLEPSIARRFGREGVGAVTQAEGSLVESQFTGTDVGTGIRQAGRSIADMEADLRRIEGRLAGRLGAGERQNLESEAQQLRQSIRARQQSREEAQELLANTPMTFIYGSGDLVPGVDRRRPVRDALRQAGANFVDGVSLLFVLIVTILPWALAALLGWLGWRAVRRRRERAEARAEALAAPAPAEAGPAG
jgi:hypothetical protein